MESPNQRKRGFDNSVLEKDFTISDQLNSSMRNAIFSSYSSSKRLKIQQEFYRKRVHESPQDNSQNAKKKLMCSTPTVTPICETIVKATKASQGDSRRKKLKEKASKPRLFHFKQGPTAKLKRNSLFCATEKKPSLQKYTQEMTYEDITADRQEPSIFDEILNTESDPETKPDSTGTSSSLSIKATTGQLTTSKPSLTRTKSLEVLPKQLGTSTVASVIEPQAKKPQAAPSTTTKGGSLLEAVLRRNLPPTTVQIAAPNKQKLTRSTAGSHSGTLTAQSIPQQTANASAPAPILQAQVSSSQMPSVLSSLQTQSNPGLKSLPNLLSTSSTPVSAPQTSTPVTGAFNFGSTPKTQAPSIGGFTPGIIPQINNPSGGGFNFGTSPNTQSSNPTGVILNQQATAPSGGIASFGTIPTTAVGGNLAASSATLTNTTNAGGFSFGTTPNTQTSAQNTGGFKFGTAPKTHPSTTPNTGGFNPGSNLQTQSAASNTGGFSFGTAPQTQANAPTTGGFAFGTAPKTQASAPTGGFNFGSKPQSQPNSTSGGFNSGSISQNQTSAPNTGGFSFGTTPTTQSTAPSTGGFSFGTAPKTQASAQSGGFNFGSNPQTQPSSTSGGFNFGNAPKTQSATPSTGGFSFGTTPKTQPSTQNPGGFNFSTAPKPQTNAPISGGFNFGSTPQVQQSSNPGGFNFGATPQAPGASPFSTNPQPSAPGGFTFESTPNVQKTALSQPQFGFGSASSNHGNTAGGFGFGTPTKAPENKPAAFNFGSSQTPAPGGASPFNFGASNPPQGNNTTPFKSFPGPSGSPAFGRSSTPTNASPGFNIGNAPSAPARSRPRSKATRRLRQ